MAILSPVSSLHDLRIISQDSTLVFPIQETEKRSIFLSNLDQILNYNIPTAHFFSSNPGFIPEAVIERFKKGLERVLVTYDFMAGRLRLNLKTGCNEIYCNAAGVGFVVASSQLSLEDIWDHLAHPNLGFQQLAPQKLENLPLDVEQPLCIFQVTTFKCGGFAIGMSMNHILFDGLGAKIFIENLASQAFEHKPLSVIPCNDRRLLAARSPPKVSFPHPEFLKLNLPVGEGSSPPTFDCVQEELESRNFKFSSTNIKLLKEKAKNNTNNGKENTMKISSFAVVAALIWRCKALSRDPEYDKDRVSTLVNVIDIRNRVNPPLPLNYGGNGVLPLGVSATCGEIDKWPFSKLVELISEGAKEMTDEYAKSAFDWLELNRGIPYGEYMVSSWLRLGFDQVEYPWGKPIYSCPVVNHRKDICWVFPDTRDGEIIALVSLPPKEMKRFEGVFYRCLHDYCPA